LEKGVVSGPASALVWNLQYFVMSFFRSRGLAKIAGAGARIFLTWIKYLDLLLAYRPGAFDASSGYYFMGSNQKRPVITPDQLVQAYRGIRR
jgi:hypothetical protein